MEKSGGAADGADTGALKGEFDQLNGRIARLEQTPGGAPSRKAMDAQNAAAARLNERVAMLEKTAPPTDLAVRLDGFALKSGEDALDTRVSKLESQNASDVMKHAATLLALADLVHASAGGEAFTTELSTLRALSPNTPELSDLSRYAERRADPCGARLSAHRQCGCHPCRRTREQSAWLDTEALGQSRQSRFHSPRRRGSRRQHRKPSRPRRIRSPQRRSGARCAEMDALKGAARNAVAPWLAQAKARLVVDRDTRSMMARVIASDGAASMIRLVSILVGAAPDRGRHRLDRGPAGPARLHHRDL